MASVARAGDVSATPGTTPVTGSTGAWSAGTISETTTSVFTSDRRAIVVEARCTFSYSGNTTSTPSSPVSQTSTVTLRPHTRALKVGGSPPLVDGDREQDSYGNALSVGSDATWSTA